MSRLLLAFSLLLLVLRFSEEGARAQGPAVPAGSRFVFAHFRNDGGGGDERLYISVSPDGLNWTALNGGNPVWQPVGWSPFGNVVRDPSIIYRDGFYWVGYTSGNYGNHDSFGLVKSRDLLNWTLVGEIKVTVPGATGQLTWNPVFFRDGDGTVHAFINISPSGGPTYNPGGTMRTYETHPVSDDWAQWSVPQPLQLPSGNTNEFFAWKEGDTYHAIYVDFSQASAWVKVSSPNLITGWGNAHVLGANTYEGGLILKKPDGSGYRFFAEPGNGNGGLSGTYNYCDLNPSFTAATSFTAVISSIPMRNGKITSLVGSSTYEQWKNENLSQLSTPEQSADADPDRDGLSNLLEASTGSRPLASDPVQPLRITSYPTFIYQRAPYLAASVEPEESSDLSSWLEQTTRTDSITLRSDGTEEVHSTLLAPLGSTRFIRLRATLPAPFAPLLLTTQGTTPTTLRIPAKRTRAALRPPKRR